ncbi:hypothetical protein AB9M62_57255 [Bacillales bacterium AN1005]
MLAMSQGAIRLTFPITPAEIQITSGNDVDSFNVITGQERTGKPTSKLKRVSFTAILPREWREIWETDKKQTVTYKRPETTWQLLEKWKPKPVVINFEELFSQTMLIADMEIVYKDGQGNIHMTMTLVEYKPVKIISYSNTKQLLKPGVIITKASKSRPNTTSKSGKKDDKKKTTTKKKVEAKKKSTAAAKDAADNATGAFDYTGRKNDIAAAMKKTSYIQS